MRTTLCILMMIRAFIGGAGDGSNSDTNPNNFQKLEQKVTELPNTCKFEEATIGNCFKYKWESFIGKCFDRLLICAVKCQKHALIVLVGYGSAVLAFLLLLMTLTAYLAVRRCRND